MKKDLFSFNNKIELNKESSKMFPKLLKFTEEEIEEIKNSFSNNKHFGYLSTYMKYLMFEGLKSVTSTKT